MPLAYSRYNQAIYHSGSGGDIQPIPATTADFRDNSRPAAALTTNNNKNAAHWELDYLSRPFGVLPMQRNEKRPKPKPKHAIKNLGGGACTGVFLRLFTKVFNDKFLFLRGAQKRN
jgi:hypothetical protein